MSDLFAGLTAAARALDAQSTGLAVVGQNIANVNTAGYTRRVIDLAAVAPEDRWSAGSGVEVVGIHSARDLLVESRLAQEVSVQSEQGAIADGLAAIDAAFGAPGASIDSNLTAFFDAFSALADDPIALSSRESVVAQADSLATAFHEMTGHLADAAADADTRMRTAVDQVNALAQQIASWNAAIATSGAPGSAESLQLQDDEVQAISSMSELLDVHTIAREDGGFDVTFGNGRPLVVGGYAVRIETATAANGQVVLRTQDMDVTAEVTGGQIGGLRQVRDVRVPDYMARLDALAYAVVDQVNTLHGAGFDLDGTQGGAFFTLLASADGAAAAISVNPDVADNPRLIAAAGIPTVGDNGTARAIAALRGAKTLDNGTATFAEGFGSLAFRVGQDRAMADTQQASAAEVVRQVRNLRESVSGVSLDQEAALMLKFQRAYEANARYFQTVNDALQMLMQMVGGQ